MQICPLFLRCTSRLWPREHNPEIRTPAFLEYPPYSPACSFRFSHWGGFLHPEALAESKQDWPHNLQDPLLNDHAVTPPRHRPPPALALLCRMSWFGIRWFQRDTAGSGVKWVGISETSLGGTWKMQIRLPRTHRPRTPFWPRTGMCFWSCSGLVNEHEMQKTEVKSAWWGDEITGFRVRPAGADPSPAIHIH